MAHVDARSAPTRLSKGAGRYPQPVALLAPNFDLHLLPEFEASPTDELHLVLLMKDVRRTLR